VVLKKIELSKDIQSVELLRGLAAAMVCYFHLTQGNQNFLSEGSLVKKAGIWGWTGVEIFFVISGFIIPYAMYLKKYKINNFPTFLKKRILRIEPPYLISIVLVIALNYLSTLSPYYKGAPFIVDWGNLASHLAYLNIFTNGTWLNPVYWSLAIEFQYYLLMALCFGMIISDKATYRFLFFGLFISLSFLPLPANKFIFTYSCYFLLGITLFQFVCNVISKSEFLVLLLIVASVLCYSQGLMLLLISTGALFVIYYINNVPRFLRFLGVISYSLYLIHVPIGGRIINLSASFVQSPFLRECIVFASFITCIIASSFFYRFFEKPFKRISGSIGYNKSSHVLQVHE
jgi:peptidoglycan/LPS O-acetylase OafA/YrhL